MKGPDGSRHQKDEFARLNKQETQMNVELMP
jgi:hypothetical protein